MNLRNTFYIINEHTTFNNNVIITILEHITKDNISTEEKKNLLRQQEFHAAKLT